MNFFSHIELPKALIDISYLDLNMFLGSCFAENIGNKFIEHKFQVDLNPFGVLYNPESIACSLQRLMENVPINGGELFSHQELYHSFSHHSSFSDTSQEACLQKINERIALSAGNLRKASKLFITFGTAYGYYLAETGQVVSNCHKLPGKHFTRKRLSIQQIVESWEKLLADLFTINKELKIIFSVSPVRYWQDGVHENQLSKSTLLLAVEELRMRFPDEIVYFPAYELMLDELRDYRFYADDLFHLSGMAIQFIWESLVEVSMNEQTKQLMKEISQIHKSLSHKPFNYSDELHKQFISQTLLKIEQLRTKTPYLCFENEIEALKKRSRNQEAGIRRPESGGRRLEAGDRRQETGIRRQELESQEYQLPSALADGTRQPTTSGFSQTHKIREIRNQEL